MQEQTGRVAGVDYGTVRIGIAISDPGRAFSSPLTTYTRKTEDRDAKFFRELVERERIVRFALGVPIHLDGGVGEKAKESLEFGRWLRVVTGLEVDLVDERFTSIEADEYMRTANMSRKRKKENRDRLAAQILLRNYLESGCIPDHEWKGLDE